MGLLNKGDFLVGVDQDNQLMSGFKVEGGEDQTFPVDLVLDQISREEDPLLDVCKDEAQQAGTWDEDQYLACHQIWEEVLVHLQISRLLHLAGFP